MKTPQELSESELIERWNSLSETEKSILGRPNFMCAKVAQRLKQKGFKCKPKAEEEQALTIFTLLQFYKAYEEGWEDKANEFLKSKTTDNG